MQIDLNVPPSRSADRRTLGVVVSSREMDHLRQLASERHSTVSRLTKHLLSQALAAVGHPFPE